MKAAVCHGNRDIRIVLMFFAPQGIWGLLYQRFDLELFPVQRRLPLHLQ